MNPIPSEWNWLDASETMGVADLSRACRVTLTEVDELVEYGALRPLHGEHEAAVFSAACVASLRTACKLREDYDLDIFTVALLVGYLDRIEGLERELRVLHAHLPAHVIAAHRDGPQQWRERHARGEAGA
jgi:chaperone modulatory protein CbpM